MKSESKQPLLIIEDQENHLEEAKLFLSADPALYCRFQVDYASTLKDALGFIEGNRYAGIISDVFFPSGLQEDREIRKSIADKFREEFEAGEKYWRELVGDRYDGLRLSWDEAVKSWETGLDIPPLGVYIALQVKNIPLVFNTSTWHHGFKSEPVREFANMNKIPYIETGDPYNKNGEASYKNWEAAYNSLISKIDKVS